MLTIIESPLFTRLWPDYWTETEHDEFAAFLASNPEAGDVVPGSGGCRKIRWSRTGLGKRGGVRVIYTAQLASGAVVLLVIYAKSTVENIPSHILREIAEEMGHASS
ncbi:MAG: transcriptional regulator [Sulfuricella sp.]